MLSASEQQLMGTHIVSAPLQQLALIKSIHPDNEKQEASEIADGMKAHVFGHTHRRR